ncbi:MAG TPA: type II toxin-antitoxin system death-on-curing family toxin [Thermoanaerobaculia bacterium]|jgi:death-on-curing protein
MKPRFLTRAEILAIHERQIARYGGSSGIRDVNLLESARANVEATFGGEFLHETLFAMAAAYLYGICRNHPFIDGNKRTALACALVFVRLNGYRIVADADELYDLVIAVAEGRVTKDDVTSFLTTHT